MPLNPGFLIQANWIIEGISEQRIATPQELEYQGYWLYLLGYLSGLPSSDQTRMIEELDAVAGDPEKIREYYNNLSSASKWQEPEQNTKPPRSSPNRIDLN